MNHSDAIQNMSAERYLLGEMTVEDRELFEEHYFTCEDCALDLRAAMAFIGEAKVQLPGLIESPRLAPAVRPAQEKKKSWLGWLTPAFSAPAMAVLLGVVAYQNLATIPALRSAATRPEVLPWVSIHMGTRSGVPTPVSADRTQGVVLLVDLPQQGSYVSYAFELFDDQGKSVWKGDPKTLDQTDNGTVSVLVPGGGLREGVYALAAYGVMPSGERTETSRRMLDIRFGK
jgi:hypothetical protein